MEGGREQNYWPGFVDALSNVVLTLVFVLVIFVFALAMASNKIDQKLQEIKPVDNAKMLAMGVENEKLKSQLSSLQAEIDKLNKEAKSERRDASNGSAAPSKVVATMSRLQQAGSTELKVVANSNNILITFPSMASDIDERASSEMELAIAAITQKLGKYRVFIRTAAGGESYSVTNRVAYYRAINVRSVLVEKMQILPASIDMKTVPVGPLADGQVEVSFNAQ